MIIIFEGTDCVGKTTLLNKVATKLNYPTFKRDRTVLPDAGNAFDCYIEIDLLLDFINQTNINLIVDRLWLSEIVYSEVYGREYNKKAYELFDLTMQNQSIIICVTANGISIKNRFAKEDMVTFDKALEIQQKYFDYIHILHTPLIFIDNSDNVSIDINVDKIVNIINKYNK